MMAESRISRERGVLPRDFEGKGGVSRDLSGGRFFFSFFSFLASRIEGGKIIRGADGLEKA